MNDAAKIRRKEEDFIGEMERKRFRGQRNGDSAGAEETAAASVIKEVAAGIDEAPKRGRREVRRHGRRRRGF